MCCICGKINNRYQVDVTSAQTIKFEVTGRGIAVDNIFYENTNLLVKTSVDKGEYLWNI